MKRNVMHVKSIGKKIKAALIKAGSGCIIFGKAAGAAVIAVIKGVAAFFKFRVVKRFRSFLVYHSIREGIDVGTQKRADLEYYWQPMLYVSAKIALVILISYNIYILYPILGGYIEKGFEFFRLHEIYNFDFPKPSFFDTIAKYLLLFVVGYHGLYFLYFQIQALFSTLVIDKQNCRMYYLKNAVIHKQVYVITLREINYLSLNQNLLFRLLRMGSIVVEKKNGESIKIASLMNAPKAMKYLTPAVQGQDPGA